MKRGIAGSLIFQIFDRSALHHLIEGTVTGDGAKYYARPTDVANPGEYAASQFSAPGVTTGRRGSELFTPTSETAGQGSQLAAILASRGAGGGLTPNGQVLVNDLRPVNYVDQMQPFDIVLSAQNELGLRMGMQIFGVELLNQGSGVSVDDVVIEAQIS